MKNPFLQLLKDPSSLVTVEFDKAEKETIVRMLEEKVNNAIAEYDNPERHEGIYDEYNNWLHYLDTQWDGKLNYTFEVFAEGIGIQKWELYKLMIGLLVDKHLDYVCEHETNIDNDTLDELRINHNIHVHDDMDDDIDEDNFCIMTGAC